MYIGKVMGKWGQVSNNKKVLLYLFISCAWILLSEVGQEYVRSSFSLEVALKIEVYKGIAFVCFSAFFFWRILQSTAVSAFADGSGYLPDSAAIGAVSLLAEKSIFFVCSADGKLLHISSGLSECLKQDTPSRSFDEIIQAITDIDFQSIVTSIGEKGRWKGEATSKTCPGLYFWVEVYPLSDTSEVQYVVFLTNVTEWKRKCESYIAKQLLLEQKVDETTIEVENIHKERDEFISIAAHDLKNPLAAITIATRTLKMEAQKDNAEKRLERIAVLERSCKRMSEIISLLLDLRTLTNPNSAIQWAPIDCSALAHQAIDAIMEPARKKNINIEACIQERVCCLSEERLLRGILDNYLSNAVKFSPSDTTIRVVVSVEEQNNERHLLLSVADEGPGIKESEQMHLFHAFAKISNKPTGDELTSGLGLSIVKKMTQLLEGEAWCESSIGKGATFFARFPMKAVPENIT